MPGISAGSAFVDIVPSFRKFSKELNKQIAGAGSGLRKFGDKMSRAGNKLTIGLTLPLVALGKTAFDAASDLNESMSKVNVVFEDSADVIVDWSKTSAKALGISQQEALEAAGTFGNLFRAMKIGTKPAADMSKQLVGLASDLASFNNANPEDVLLALRSGLVGEAEPLRKFGVSLSAARIEAEALSLGMKKQGGVFTAAQKAQAAYSIILKDTTLAQGDFARTADGAANKQRIMSAQFKDAAATIGTKLLPIGIKLLDFATGLLEKFQNLSPGAQDLVLKLGLMAVALGPVVKIGGSVAKTMGALKKGFALARAAIVKFTGAKLAEKTALDANNKSAKAGTTAVKGFGGAVKKLAPALATAAKGAGTLAAAYAIGTVSSENLAQTHRRLSKQVNEFIADIKAGRDQILKTSTGVQGLSNYLVVLAKRGEGAAVAAIKQAVAQKHGTVIANQAAAAAEKLLGTYKDQTEILPIVTSKTQLLINAIGKIPSAKSIKITTPGMAAALSNLNALREVLGDVGSVGVTIYSNKLPGMQHGGPVWSGGSYLVGEAGPEVFTPSMSGRITPNDALGGQTINFYITGPDPRAIANEVDRKLREVGAKVNARRRVRSDV